MLSLLTAGADISLAPRELAERIGVDWARGRGVRLSGISPKPECSVDGRVHRVTAIVPDLALELRIPLCFADEAAPYLIGRDGFFDWFKVSFDKKNKRTTFALRGRPKSSQG